MKLLLGDCLDKLKELDDNSIDSIVTDPPYGLSFMGKSWDYDVPSQEIWEECLRVLKPGGHLLAFAGSRTYHRMAVRIEDAGFEIRDQIMWVYGSGFPKSLNIGKELDKKFGNTRKIIDKNSVHIQSGGKRNTEDSSKIDKFERKIVYKTKGSSEWEGWGTALKPAHEPIVMARKPLSEKTIVDNVLEWGTGGINIDESRIEYQSDNDRSGRHKTGADGSKGFQGEETFKIRHITAEEIQERTAGGRFPANVIFDEEAGKILDEQSGTKGGNNKGAYTYKDNEYQVERFINNVKPNSPSNYGDVGGASRFFYCPKASKKDRNEGCDDLNSVVGDIKNIASSRLKCKKCDKGAISANFCQCETKDWIIPETKNNHPTVKPTDLMAYLIKLVTPKGGTVLDPFMGSGSTGKAAVREGMDFIGIEREDDYIKIAEARISHEQKKQIKQGESNVDTDTINKFFE